MDKRNFLRKRYARLTPSQIKHRQKEEKVLLIPPSINDIEEYIKDVMGESTDIVYRCVTLGEGNLSAAIVYVESLVDQEKVNEQVMKAVLSLEHDLSANIDVIDFCAMKLIAVGHISVVDSRQELIHSLLLGKTLLLVNGHSKAICIETAGWESRSISEPSVENEVKGSRESFVENLGVNISMIRRRIKNENLRILSFRLGTITKTEIRIVYLHDVADALLVEEIKKRLNRIHIDGVLESFYMEEWIEDHPNSMFPQVDYSERPDKVAGMLLEGRIAILTDGTPWALLAPAVFFQFFTTSGDYYSNKYFATFLRWLRIVAFLFALTIPAFYIAVTTMHQEMLPTSLALRIAGARSGVPFPAIVEALILEISFEILREAGIRLPKVAGQAVSIVGALIIGEAAVEAGIVSPIMVIVVALTGISSFAIPRYELAMAVRILRFPLMLIASIVGIPGITVLLLILLTYLVSLNSFGVSYFSPLSPLRIIDVKDTFFRASWRSLAKGIHNFGVKPNQGSEFDVGDQDKRNGTNKHSTKD